MNGLMPQVGRNGTYRLARRDLKVVGQLETLLETRKEIYLWRDHSFADTLV